MRAGRRVIVYRRAAVVVSVVAARRRAVIALSVNTALPLPLPGRVGPGPASLVVEAAGRRVVPARPLRIAGGKKLDARSEGAVLVYFLGKSDASPLKRRLFKHFLGLRVVVCTHKLDNSYGTLDAVGHVGEGHLASHARPVLEVAPRGTLGHAVYAKTQFVAHNHFLGASLRSRRAIVVPLIVVTIWIAIAVTVVTLIPHIPRGWCSRCRFLACLLHCNHRPVHFAAVELLYCLLGILVVLIVHKGNA